MDVGDGGGCAVIGVQWKASGALVWLVAFGGYLTPIDKSRFFDRGAISAMLAVALALWAMVFTHLIFTTASRHLHHL